MAQAAVRTSTPAAFVHLPLTDIPAFVTEMEAFGFRYIAWVDRAQVLGVFRMEPREERAEDTDAINDLLWRLRATSDWKRGLGEFCVVTGRVC